MWEARAVCGISKRGGNGGKVGGRTFPPFPPRVISTANPQLCPFWRKCGGGVLLTTKSLFYRKPRKMPTSSDSCGEPKKLTRDLVVPIISATISWLIFGNHSLGFAFLAELGERQQNPRQPLFA